MFCRPIYIYSAAARRRCGGAMAAVDISTFRYISILYWVFVSSIVDKYTKSYGHISKCTQKPQKTSCQHRS